jgi:hypothetical protein
LFESSTSTVVPPNHQFRIDEYANIIISKKQKMSLDKFTSDIIQDSLIAIGEAMFEKQFKEQV